MSKIDNINIYELDKTKSYIVEIDCNNICDLHALVTNVKNTFKEVDIQNCIIVPVGKYLPINGVNVKEYS